MNMIHAAFAAAVLLAAALPAHANGFDSGGPSVQGPGPGGGSRGGYEGTFEGSFEGTFGGALPEELTSPASFAPCGPQLEETRVAVVNEGRSDIWYVQMSPIEYDEYGDDLLGPEEIIMAGDYVTLEVTDYAGACRFDVLITFEGGEELAIWDVDLCDVNVVYASEQGYEVDYEANI